MTVRKKAIYEIFEEFLTFLGWVSLIFIFIMLLWTLFVVGTLGGGSSKPYDISITKLKESELPENFTFDKIFFICIKKYGSSFGSVYSYNKDNGHLTPILQSDLPMKCW